jgi:hypothetical protein
MKPSHFLLILEEAVVFNYETCENDYEKQTFEKGCFMYYDKLRMLVRGVIASDSG